MLAEATISPEDVDLLRITDDPAEAAQIINAYVTERRASAARTHAGTKAIQPEEATADAKRGAAEDKES
jgi:hypothetical protein